MISLLSVYFEGTRYLLPNDILVRLFAPVWYSQTTEHSWTPSNLHLLLKYLCKSFREKLPTLLQIHSPRPWEDIQAAEIHSFLTLSCRGWSWYILRASLDSNRHDNVWVCPLRRSGIHSSAKVGPTVMEITPGMDLSECTPSTSFWICVSDASDFTLRSTMCSITVDILVDGECATHSD